MIHLDFSRYPEARELLSSAIKQQKLALVMNSSNPNYRRDLTRNFENLLKAAVGLEDSNLAEEAQRGMVELATSDPKFAELDARLVKVLGGESANDAAELLALGQRSYDLLRYVQVARFFGEALEREPTLANDRNTQIGYNAACAAALACSGQGLDDPKPDEAARTKLSAQAVHWLRGELEQWGNFHEHATPEQRAVVVRTLKHWQGDLDLACVRDEAARARLPEAERAEWQGLWNRVEELLAKANAPVDSAAEPAK